ncbi:MAG: GntR family transcriptional regulator [Qingshengfaniella sp.]
MTAENSTKSAIGSVVDSLEQQIIFGSLLPKQRLYEDEFIVRYGAKRHVIRAALQELERRGIVERIPNRGAIVKFYSRQDVADLYVVRAILHEAGAQRIGLPADPVWLAALKDTQAAHSAAIAAEDLAAVFRTNTLFHRKLFEGTRNAYLVEAIEQSNSKTHGIRSHGLGVPRLLAQAEREHLGMIACIEAGDRAGLTDLCLCHMDAARQFYEEKYCAPVQLETGAAQV